MPSRREKVAAHAEHLLDAFLRLRATYAVLDPLLFNQTLAARWRTGPAAHGRHILLNTVLYSCVLEASKLTLDKDPRTPSLQSLDTALDDAPFRAELREAYAVLNLYIEEDDPEVLRLLRESEKRDDEKRRQDFDALVKRFRAGWRFLRDSPTLKAFEILRDKVIAHNEIRHDGSTYRTFDVASLDLKFGDLRAVVQALEPIVDSANLLFRAASFDFEESDQQLRSAGEQFWAVVRDG